MKTVERAVLVLEDTPHLPYPGSGGTSMRHVTSTEWVLYLPRNTLWRNLREDMSPAWRNLQ